MEILIFGANGQDGQYLRRLAQLRGWSVAAVSRRNAPILGDVADAALVTALIRERRPDLIFHLAARSSTRHDAAAENHATIGAGTLNILEAALRHSPASRISSPAAPSNSSTAANPFPRTTPSTPPAPTPPPAFTPTTSPATTANSVSRFTSATSSTTKAPSAPPPTSARPSPRPPAAPPPARLSASNSATCPSRRSGPSPATWSRPCWL